MGGIDSLELAVSSPSVTTPIAILSGYHSYRTDCEVENIVHQLLEGRWTFSDSIRYLVTSRAEWDRQVDLYPGDNPVNARSHRSFKEAGLTQKQWIEACQQAPSKICLHLPSTLEKSIAQKLQTVVSNFYPDIVCTISQEPKQRTSSDWVVRFLWALQFHRQMDFRYAMFEGPGSCNGRRASGTYDFWLHGTPLSNLPSSNSMELKNRCKDTYASVVNLLAERPWSVFAPYEALKVTLKMDTTETTQYVLFSDGECHFGHEKSNSPFGVMEILEDKSSVTSRFGRRMMWAQSGFLAAPEQCPDRLFVTSESLSRVHYDSILLLEDLFGAVKRLLPAKMPTSNTASSHESIGGSLNGLME